MMERVSTFEPRAQNRVEEPARRFRILQVCNTDFYLTKFLAPLVRALVEEGHEVECLCEGADRVPAGMLPAGVKVHDFAFPREGSPTAFAKAILRFREFLRRGHFDCVDGHNRNASIVSRIGAWLERVPVNVYTAHGFYFHDDQAPLTREATIWLEAALARITDFTMSQSSDDMVLMVERGHIPTERIARIGNGIDTRRFAPGVDRATAERELGLARDQFRIGATGRIVKGKGFMDLLDAFCMLRKQVPNAALLMIGGVIEQDISPSQEEFISAVRNRGLENAVTITGMTQKVERYLATLDVFVLPSYREGLPRALLEAMSMEVPVVATEIRGCREAVIHGENGYLYRPRDVAELSQRLIELHAAGPLRRQALGRAARHRVLERFDERDYVAVQVDCLTRLLGEGPARDARSWRRRTGEALGGLLRATAGRG